MKSDTLISSRDIVLDYAEQGRRLGTPVIFLHGFTDSRRSFDRIMLRLPASIHAIAVSMRGHGDSTRPPEGYAPADFAADIAALMDRLELKDALIVGHSMGAAVAQCFALDFPGRTRGLVLVSSFFGFKDHAVVGDFWKSVVSTLSDPVDPLIVRDFQMSTISRSVPPVFLNTIIRESLKVPAEVWKTTLKSLMDSALHQELHRIQAPTLLVWGERDLFVSRTDQEALLAAIRSARLSVYAGVGHAPHWEDPERFARELLHFVLQLRTKEV